MKRFSENRIWILPLCAIVVILTAAAAGTYFSDYSDEQLYEESVSQLEELSAQLFEKLEVQIDIQWGYIDKLRNTLDESDAYTAKELAKLLAHGEADLGPVDKHIYFRAIDEEGYYYTSEGRQGLWTGLDRLSGDTRQSFLIANWLDDENYMAFAMPMTEGITVDGEKLSYVLLLRSMTDMQPFFHSSAFENQNIAYITDYNGFVMASDGQLQGIDFSGRNIYRSMEEQEYPHMGSFSAVLEAGNPSGTICTDVCIGENKFYLVYDRLPDYDWAVLLLMSADDVAVNTSHLVNSLMRTFLITAIAVFVAFLIGAIMVAKMQRDKRLMVVREQNAMNLEQINRELVREQEKTQAALEAAENATRAKSQFLSNMSHDIRTPMNAIVGVANLMEYAAEEPEKIRYYISKLQSSGQHMLGLINDILDMSKIESDEVVLGVEPVKIADQIGQIDAIIRPQSNEKGQEFTILLRGMSHEYLLGDGIRIRQIFLNLLNNAVKYTPYGGRIRMELEELPCDTIGCATIQTSVIDNGCGMSAEFLQKIYEPFAREESTLTNKVQGTGLGMSITKSLVDLMHGTIHVKSEVDSGSRFDVTLTLPIDTEVVFPASISSVLLVTDEELLIHNLTAALQETDSSLIVCDSPDKAAEVLRTQPVDVVLLSGYLDTKMLAETVQQLRGIGDEKLLIFCVDYAHYESVQEMLRGSGIDGLITRPFFYDNLMLAVTHVRGHGRDAAWEQPHALLAGRRFLCAEDNVLNAEILEELLKMQGATCKVYPNGEALVEAFADVRPGDYDAILMDVQMPRMNGLEATRAIRLSDNPLGAHIPIIAMTANAFSQDVEECLAAGMDEHLSKPLDIAALGRMLRELSGESGGRVNR